MYCEKYVEMGRKIRYYRIMQELGQGMLAEQIGITPQYLSKIEHGSARPSIFTGPINKQDGSVWLAEGQTAPDGDLLGMNFYVEGIKGDIPK